MSRRCWMIGFLCALTLPGAARAEDASLGGMLKGLHCITELTAFSYALDGRSQVPSPLSGATVRGSYTLDMGSGTVCNGDACPEAAQFKVTAVTDRISYKEVRFVADFTEYRVSIVDASSRDAVINLDVIRKPQSKGSSRQSGACQRT